jgi:hypothetical protein
LSLTISDKWVKGEQFPHSPWIIDKQVRDANEEINDAQTVHVHVHGVSNGLCLTTRIRSVSRRLNVEKSR